MDNDNGLSLTGVDADEYFRRKYAAIKERQTAIFERKEVVGYEIEEGLNRGGFQESFRVEFEALGQYIIRISTSKRSVGGLNYYSTSISLYDTGITDGGRQIYFLSETVIDPLATMDDGIKLAELLKAKIEEGEVDPLCPNLLGQGNIE